MDITKDTEKMAVSISENVGAILKEYLLDHLWGTDQKSNREISPNISGVDTQWKFC